MIWWENVTGRILDGADIAGGTQQNPFSTWRNVTDSELWNCRIRGVRLRSNSDHVDGLKIDLAKNVRLYRCTFEDNDVCHLLISYRFWEASGLPRDSDDILVEQCRFGAPSHSFNYPFYYHVQVQTSARPTRVVLKDCVFRRFKVGGFAQNPDAQVALLGGPAGVTVEIVNPTWIGENDPWPAFPGETTDPDPPDPGATVEQRLTVLEALVAEFSADLAQGSAYSVDTRALLDQRVRDLEARIVSVDSRVKAEQAWVTAQDAKATGLAHDGRIANLEVSKATRPAGLDVENVNLAIATIIKANPKIAAALVAERDALIGLFNALRA
jgi:hypothetical protein